MRLIEADAIINILDAVILEAYWQVLDRSVANTEIADNEQWININCVKAIIERAPTVEAEPVKHGRWIDKNGSIATCSVCKQRWGVWNVMNHCPDCGARMDKEETDED